MVYKHKKKSSTSGNRRDLKNSHQRHGEKYYVKAKHGISNASGGASAGESLSAAKMSLYTDSDSQKKVYAAGGTKNTYDDVFDRVSKEQGVPKPILRALAQNESSMNRDSIGRKTKHGQAVGIMQLMPATIKELGISDPFDPYENIAGGAKWLKKAYDKSGNWKDAVGMYNAGHQGWADKKEKVMAESPDYYRNIYKAIDEYNQSQQMPFIGKSAVPAVADMTSYKRQVPAILPTDKKLFPVQQTTLPSLSKPIPRPKPTGMRSAGEGYEPSDKTSDWLALYENPDLLSSTEFNNKLFNKD